MNKALIVVDVQNDFVEGGSLAVNGGKRLAIELNGWLSRVHMKYEIIVASQDWHIDPGNHWSDTPDFIDSWPVHCKADTDGAEFAGPFWWALDYTVKKGQYAAAYSAFEGVWGGYSLDKLIIDEVTDVDVVGIAYDYCVKATALDAVRLGYRTRILTDLTVPVHADSVSLSKLESDLQRAGVVLALSQEV